MNDLLNDPQMQKLVQEGKSEERPADFGDLSQLCNFGSLQESIRIGPYNFVVKTLSAGEQEKALASVAKYNIASIVVASALQNQVLARSIVSVNGIALENLPLDEKLVEDADVLAGVRNGDVHSKRLAIVLSWQDSLRHQLFQFHQDLSTRSEGIIADLNPEDLKE